MNTILKISKDFSSHTFHPTREPRLRVETRKNEFKLSGKKIVTCESIGNAFLQSSADTDGRLLVIKSDWAEMVQSVYTEYIDIYLLPAFKYFGSIPVSSNGDEDYLIDVEISKGNLYYLKKNGKVYVFCSNDHKEYH